MQEIVLEGNSMLRSIAKPVGQVDDNIRGLLDDMLETMRTNDGIGLAAPQIGVSLRVIVIEYNEKIYKVINPEIIDSGGIQTLVEGCLSIPGRNELVRRAEKIRVKGLDENGNPIKFNCQKFLAQIFQHEIDHLNGILFIDKI